MLSNGEVAQIRANLSFRSHLDVKTPSSFMKMSGCRGWQEGIYASSDLPRWGREPPQNDLGLTLLPGSQIQKAVGNTPKNTTWTTPGLHQIPETIETPDTFLEDQIARRLKDKESPVPRSDGHPHGATLGASRDINQGLARIEERKKLAENELKHLKGHQGPSLPRELLHRCPKGRLRYSDKVRGSEKESHYNQRCQKRDSESSLRVEEDKTLVNRAPKPINDASTCSGKRRAMQPPYKRKRTPLRRSLTSFYPQRSNYRTLRNVNRISHKLLFATSYDAGRSQLLGRQELVKVTRDRAYKRMQAELRQTKQELLRRTKADSDAKKVVNDLRKANDDLIDSANDYSELQKAHNSLLLEHRHVLESYERLARTHNCCRTTSSKKLAQRIIEAGASSTDSAYASRSTSIAAPSTIGSRANSKPATQFSRPATPLVDLTRAPSPTPPPPGSVSAPVTDQGDYIQEQDSSEYANINGFDDEANEMYNALWENEMVDWNASNGTQLEA